MSRRRGGDASADEGEDGEQRRDGEASRDGRGACEGRGGGVRAHGASLLLCGDR